MLSGASRERYRQWGAKQTGVEQRDRKRCGQGGCAAARTSQSQPTENCASTACPSRRRRRRRGRGWRGKNDALRESRTREWQTVEEDWEQEIKQSVPAEALEEESYHSIYDPEDVICSGLRKTTLNSEPHSVGHAYYSPAIHHVSPVKWVQLVPHVVVDQFTDAEV
ncbi:hypothetical protein GJAV_G00144930 [Gymnothorax javanicus]|nr:hypothetical protein GJAV_G00144930 [Gymnothorax javanicus]